MWFLYSHLLQLQLWPKQPIKLYLPELTKTPQLWLATFALSFRLVASDLAALKHQKGGEKFVTPEANTCYLAASVLISTFIHLFSHQRCQSRA